MSATAMEMLIGWGSLAALVVFLAILFRSAGPPGDAKPGCGARVGEGSGRGGCH